MVCGWAIVCAGVAALTRHPVFMAGFGVIAVVAAIYAGWDR
jgi:hypothetical protein